MNLDGILCEPKASLADHEWYDLGMLKEGQPTYDPINNNGNSNSKDELEIQWGYGHIDTKYSDEDGPAISGVVNRNMPTVPEDSPDSVIVFARDMMNRGFMGCDLQNKLRDRFTQENLRNASEGLRELFALDGFIGRVAIDRRGYKNVKDVMEAMSSNPYKRFIKYVIDEKRADEDYAWMPSDKIMAKIVESSENAVDDFFATDQSHTTDMVAYCKETMMPVFFAGRGDLDEEDMDSTLVELMNLGSISDLTCNQIRNADYSNINKIQKAFRSIEDGKKADDLKYAEKIDNTEFIIDKQSDDIQVFDAPMSQIDVEASHDTLRNEFMISDVCNASVVDVDMFNQMESFDLRDIVSSLHVSAQAETEDIALAEKIASSFDVDICQHNDPSFINGSFELDHEIVRNGIDVEIGSSLEW